VIVDVERMRTGRSEGRVPYAGLSALVLLLSGCDIAAGIARDIGATSGGGGGAAGGGGGHAGGGSAGGPACFLANAAFCDTFDEPSPGGRGGDLDDERWSASRVSGMDNLGQGQHNWMLSTQTSACGRTASDVWPYEDMFFCAGGSIPSMHFNDSLDDGGGVVLHSYRIRRPFDFSGRTGIIAFDVDAQAQFPGGRGYWLNVFIADEPVPAPHQEGGGHALYVKNGVAIEFEGADVACGDPVGQPAGGAANAVSRIVFERDHEVVDAVSYPGQDGSDGCFTTQEEVLNRIEIHVSQNQIAVFASDAGAPESLRRVAFADNLDLPFTRGYVSLQHVHNNAGGGSLPSFKTYHWDNVAFDGPAIATPRGYSLADSLERHIGGINLGWALGAAGSPKTFMLEDVDLSGAVRAFLTMNVSFFLYAAGDTIEYRWNERSWRTFVPPFSTESSPTRAIAVPLALSDLRSGSNRLDLRSGSGLVTMANGELVVDVE
jgi:hypothetical protein